jgi:hypothetical protein
VARKRGFLSAFIIIVVGNLVILGVAVTLLFTIGYEISGHDFGWAQGMVFGLALREVWDP